MNGLFPQMSISVSHSLGELFPGTELGKKIKIKHFFFPLKCIYGPGTNREWSFDNGYFFFGKTLSWTLLGEPKEGEHEKMKVIVLLLDKILTSFLLWLC